MDTIQIRGVSIRLIKGDITALAVDAIVNPGNNKLVMGGGVAGAIKRKGGLEIEQEALKKAPIIVGEAVETSGGGLPARYVIHAATMSMDFQTDEHKVRHACMNALKVAQDLKIETIAFPALGCGTGGFPLLASAKIMAQEVYRFIREEKSTLKSVVFCLNEEGAYRVFEKGVLGYLKHLTDVIACGPFVTVDAIININGKIVLIKRTNPPFGWALPGGFVDYGESLEDAVVREAKEETGLDIRNVRQFHTYSQPRRDPRFHTIGTVFACTAQGSPCAGDDAGDVALLSPEEIMRQEFAFDHKQILVDYIQGIY